MDSNIYVNMCMEGIKNRHVKIRPRRAVIHTITYILEALVLETVPSSEKSKQHLLEYSQPVRYSRAREVAESDVFHILRIDLTAPKSFLLLNIAPQYKPKPQSHNVKC